MVTRTADVWGLSTAVGKADFAVANSKRNTERMSKGKNVANQSRQVTKPTKTKQSKNKIKTKKNQKERRNEDRRKH